MKVAIYLNPQRGKDCMKHPPILSRICSSFFCSGRKLDATPISWLPPKGESIAGKDSPLVDRRLIVDSSRFLRVDPDAWGSFLKTSLFFARGPSIHQHDTHSYPTMGNVTHRASFSSIKGWWSCLWRVSRCVPKQRCWELVQVSTTSLQRVDIEWSNESVWFSLDPATSKGTFNKNTKWKS
jgi:hypothetical protein